jgi:hypothetical protein
MAEIPVVCTLTADEQREQRDDLLPGLARHATARVELSTGYRFRFEGGPDILARIASTVARQRQCCRFLRFQISVEPALGPITLDVSGHAAAKAFLADLLAEQST